MYVFVSVHVDNDDDDDDDKHNYMNVYWTSLTVSLINITNAMR